MCFLKPCNAKKQDSICSALFNRLTVSQSWKEELRPPSKTIYALSLATSGRTLVLPHSAFKTFF
jgi:hypothetical protein